MYTITLMFTDPNAPRRVAETDTAEKARATAFHWLGTLAAVKGVWIDDPEGERHVFNYAGYLFTINRSTSIL